MLLSSLSPPLRVVVLAALGAALVMWYRRVHRPRRDDDDGEDDEEEGEEDALKKGQKTDRLRALYTAYVAAICVVAYVARARVVQLLTPNRIATFLVVVFAVTMQHYKVPLPVIIATAPVILLGVPHGLRMYSRRG